MYRFFTLLFFQLSLRVLAQTPTYEEVVEKQIIRKSENSQWAMRQPYLIMISIDGCRYDYAEKFHAKNLLDLRQSGIHAKRLIPSFPSKTFPNHYTLVTGLFPGNHGIVSNEFYSRSKDSWYAVRDRSAVQDSSWYGGTPLWVLAEQQGMLSASFFWVGSEAPIKGVLPAYNYAYDGSVPNAHRIRQLLEWLQLPERRRPHLILGYFSIVDDAGHRFGPDHPQTKEAMLQVDSLIGVLRTGIQKSGLPVHLVLVSDHGMSPISRGQVLPEAADLGDSRVAYSFPPMIYQNDSAEVERIYHQLLQSKEIEVYKSNNVPTYLNFENEDRIGDLVLITKPPVIIMDKPGRVYGGTHGFDPYADVNMGGIFYAAGPLLKEGLQLPPLENIHVYPFVAAILGLEITEPIDGSADSFEAIFK